MKKILLISISLALLGGYNSHSQNESEIKEKSEMDEKYENLKRIENGEDLNVSSTSGAYGTINYLTEEEKQKEAAKENKQNGQIVALSLLVGAVGLITIVYFGRRNYGTESIDSKDVSDVDSYIDTKSVKNAFNSTIDSKLRTDGYYHATKSVNSTSLNFIMFFTSKGFVAYQELDEFDDSELTTEEYQQIIAEGEALDVIEISNNLTKFHKRGVEISMKFYNPNEDSNIDPIEKVPYEEPNTYKKWSGKVIPDGLLLDLETSNFNTSLKRYSSEKLITNLKFKFVPISIS